MNWLIYVSICISIIQYNMINRYSYKMLYVYIYISYHKTQMIMISGWWFRTPSFFKMVKLHHQPMVVFFLFKWFIPNHPHLG